MKNTGATFSQRSRMASLLIGKRLNLGRDTVVDVADIRKTARGDRRLIIAKSGEHLMVPKKMVQAAMHRTIMGKARQKAAASLRHGRYGTTVTLGGRIKGVRRMYRTKAAAKAAITRHYGKKEE